MPKSSNDVECPTCWAKGEEVCIRGRAPSVIWMRGEPFPEGHDSRRTAQKNFDKKNTKENTK